MQKKSASFCVLLSSSLVSLALGSIHAFSVFLEPLELQFSASRSLASLTYSIALVALTFAVLIGHKVFSRLSPCRFVGLVCLAAAAGAIVAAYATTLPIIWIGYGLIFGCANGFGYAFGLQMSAQANPGHEGLAMGIVTACYALGAAISPVMFSWALAFGGFQSAMFGLAATMIFVAPISMALFKFSGIPYLSDEKEQNSVITPRRQINLLWLGYGAGVAAGLMAIGHATGIAKSGELRQSLWIAPVIIAIFSMTGSLLGGWLVDHIQRTILLVSLSLGSALALLFLAFNDNRQATLLGLGIVGLTYGAMIAVYPASISKKFGSSLGTKIYGRVFTAWGCAGLFAPWVAGFLFDRSGGYTLALIIAAFLGIVSAAAVVVLHNYERATSK